MSKKPTPPRRPKLSPPKIVIKTDFVEDIDANFSFDRDVDRRMAFQATEPVIVDVANFSRDDHPRQVFLDGDHFGDSLLTLASAYGWPMVGFRTPLVLNFRAYDADTVTPGHEAGGEDYRDRGQNFTETINPVSQTRHAVSQFDFGGGRFMQRMQDEYPVVEGSFLSAIQLPELPSGPAPTMHVPMIDFVGKFSEDGDDDEVLGTVQEVLEPLRFLPDLAFGKSKHAVPMIFNSGNSYHAYFPLLLTPEQWRMYMGGLLLANCAWKNAHKGEDAIDVAWVGRALVRGYSSLRWTAHTKPSPRYIGQAK